MKLAGGHVQPQDHLGPRPVARLDHPLQQQLDGLLVVPETRGEPALVAHRGAVVLPGQHAFQGAVDLRAGAQGFGERTEPPGDHHEFLDIDVVVGMGAAVDHVEHGHRQSAGLLSAEVPVQRHLVGRGLGPGRGQGHAENGVGAQSALVRSAVQVDHGLVQLALVSGIQPHDPPRQAAFDVTRGAQHALAHEAVAPVPQLDGFVLPGGRPGRHGGPALGSVGQRHLHLDGGMPA